MQPVLFVEIPAKRQRRRAALLASAALLLLGTSGGEARAEGECGPMVGQTVTCDNPTYFPPGIIYSGGGVVTLDNSSMVVGGDVVIGGTGGITQSVLNASRFLSITGDIFATTTSSNGRSSIYLDTAVSGASVGGNVNATINGRGTARVDINGVTVNGSIHALNNGSGDAGVFISGTSTIKDVEAMTFGSGLASVTFANTGNQNSQVTLSGTNGVVAKSAGIGQTGTIGAKISVDSGTLNVGNLQTGLSATTLVDSDSDAAITVRGGTINAMSSGNLLLYALANGTGDAIVTIGDDSGSSPVINSQNWQHIAFAQAYLNIPNTPHESTGKAIVEMKSGSIFVTPGPGNLTYTALSAESLTEARVTMSGGSIVMKGTGITSGHGYQAINAEGDRSAHVRISNAEISVTSEGAIGAVAAVTDEFSHPGSATMTLTDSNISVVGAGSNAIYVDGEPGTADLKISGSTVSSEGAESLALLVRGDVANVAMTDSSVSASGIGATGVFVISGSLAMAGSVNLDLTSGKISTSGNANAAIELETAAGQNSFSGATITLGKDFTLDASASQNKVALLYSEAAPDSALDFSNSGTVIGNVMMGGGASNISLSGGSFTGNIYGDSNQASGQPAANQGSDTLTWTSGSFNGTFYGQGGDDSVTVSFQDVDNGTPFSAASFDGGDGLDTLHFSNSRNFGIDGTKITNFEKITVRNASSAGFVSKGGVMLKLEGFTDADGIHTVGEVNLGEDASLAFDPDGANVSAAIEADINIGYHADLDIGAFKELEVNGSIDNRQSLSMTSSDNGDQYTLLIITGNYTGHSGSVLEMYFDPTLTGVSNALSIGGNVQGITLIDVGSTNYPGFPQAYNLVSVNPSNSIDPNAFQIKDGGRPIGAFSYTIFYSPTEFISGTTHLDPGFILAPTTSVGHIASFIDQDFIRRASMRELVAAGVALQPYVPLYEAYPSVLLDMMAMPSFETRSGGRYDRGEGLTSGPALDAVWGRIEGAFSHNDPKDATTGYDTDLSQMELQAGLDGLFLDSDAGVLIGSLTGHYKDGEAEVGSPFGGSKIRPQGWGFGGSLTFLGTGGFYIDGQAELTWFTSELKADSLALSPEDSDAFGYGLSAEIGQRIALSEGLSLTPQAQLAFTNVSIDGFTGAYGEGISFDDGQSLVGRLGLGLEKLSEWQDAAGKMHSARLYGTASINHDFLGESTAVLDNIYDLDSTPDAWSGEIAFGGSYDFTTGKTRIGLYAELTAATGFETGSYGYGGNVGLKVRW